jgi:hypothetical protein
VDVTADAALQAGRTRPIVLHFDNPIDDDLSGLSGYVEAANGCRITFGQAPDPTPGPTPEPPGTCENPRVNTYNVENPTNNPFYGIKFEYQSGTEVKDGAYDEFEVVLPANVVTGMTSVQMEAKAGTNVGMATLEGCQFDQPQICGPVSDENGFFTFYFMGAEDNGDGTYTLTYRVENLTDRGLSHATVGLPEGVVPPSPGSYQSEVCE